MAYKDRRTQFIRQNEFINKSYDRINLTVPKGKKAEIPAAAAAAGESVTAYIIGAISARMISDGLDGIGGDVQRGDGPEDPEE